MITRLKSNQVFIFGSNEQGFHGAGSAGFAMRGDSRNNWRNDPEFLRAMKAPAGSPDRIGKWAVFGVGRGYQEGREGRSYAICTVARPGQQRSITLKDIYVQLVELVQFVKLHSELEFLGTPIGCGYSGHTPEEMQLVWDTLAERIGIPSNLIVPSYRNPEKNDT
jgi:hypothetical protein